MSAWRRGGSEGGSRAVVFFTCEGSPPPSSRKEKELKKKRGGGRQNLKQSPNPNNKNSDCYISKPVQIRLSGRRSQMETVSLPVPCCSDTCNRFGRESRKPGAKWQFVSKNLQAARCGEARLLPSWAEVAGSGWTGLILIGGGSWSLSERSEACKRQMCAL